MDKKSEIRSRYGKMIKMGVFAFILCFNTLGCNSNTDSVEVTSGNSVEKKIKEISQEDIDKAFNDGFTVSSTGVLSSYHGESYDVVIPDIVTSISTNVFSKQIYLSSVIIPDSVNSINTGAFSGCTYLTEITIPNSVTSIEMNAFTDCTSLAKVNMSTSLNTVGYNIFENTPWLDSLKDEFVIIGDSLLFHYNGSGGSVQIPNGVKYIGREAFYYNSSITEIIFPPSTTELCNDYFDGIIQGCLKLEKVTIPNTITKIEGDIFENCNRLTTFVVNAGSYAETYAKENGYLVEYC